MKEIYLSLILCCFSYISFSQDRYFGYTYTTNILPKGNIDLELWHTSRFGHDNQFYHGMDQRMEFELGLGKNVQTAFYFNRYQTSASNSLNEITQHTEFGISNEWKWKLSDPSLNKVGTSLYAEWGLKGDEAELEAKLIFDKNIGKNLFAFNIVYEREYEFERKNNKNEVNLSQSPVLFDLAYMRQISIPFGIGIEFRNTNLIKNGYWQNSVLNGGPCLNYRNDRWFIIFNYLPQWVNLHKTINFPFSKVLNENEKTEVRVILGISL
ncbi:MAG TPA: hypothetical protein VGC75_06425 [Candidatus Nitrosocosmicus sp.]|jgi:hypothetical protein